MFIAVKHNLLEPSGSFQACNWTALPFTYVYCRQAQLTGTLWVTPGL
jgi:hypothetical protein